MECGWGRQCATEEDPDVCKQQAIGIVAIRDGGRIHKIPACYMHRMVLVAETDPVLPRR